MQSIDKYLFITTIDNTYTFQDFIFLQDKEFCKKIISIVIREIYKITKLPYDLFMNCSNLEYFICSNNNLTSIPYINCEKLKYFICNNNNIQYFCSHNNWPNMIELQCDDNNLKYLPIFDKCSKLEYLSCTNNNLIELPDFNKCINLQEIHCDGNNLPIIGKYSSENEEYLKIYNIISKVKKIYYEKKIGYFLLKHKNKLIK